MTLEDLGFDSGFAGYFKPYAEEGYSAARVSLEHKGSYILFTERGEIAAIPTGKMYYEADQLLGLPVVGDWVVVRVLDEDPPWATIHAIIPRRSKFSRKDPGKGIVEQPIAANIDTVFIVIGLDSNYSMRRIERYLTLAWESGANPVVLLTKSDICPDVEEKLAEAEACAPGVPVYAVSALVGTNLEAMDRHLEKGKTVALLGSSGVGKSTIINYLLGKEVQRTQEVRDFDSKGRHTTTHRQMFILPSGAMVIDTPGMRELQLISGDDGLQEVFSDIEELAKGCRFSDCRHENEPGCKVQEALRTGELDPGRFASFIKLQKELDHLHRKQDYFAALEEKNRWKKIHKSFRNYEKGRSG